MWTVLEYSIPLLHIFSLYKAVIIYTVCFTRNIHTFYAGYVHRSSPVKASHRWIGESLPVLTRLDCKKHMKLCSLLGCEMTVLVRDLRFSQKQWWRLNVMALPWQAWNSQCLQEGNRCQDVDKYLPTYTASQSRTRCSEQPLLSELQIVWILLVFVLVLAVLSRHGIGFLTLENKTAWGHGRTLLRGLFETERKWRHAGMTLLLLVARYY